MSLSFSFSPFSRLFPHVVRFFIPSFLMQLIINAPCSYFRLMDNFTGLVEFIVGLIWSFEYLLKSQDDALHWRTIFTSVCVLLWSLRLGGFLVYRMLVLGPVDTRIDQIKHQYGNKGVFAFWFFGHGNWSTLCCAPVALIHAFSTENIPVNTIDICGFSIWTLGFIVEAIADHKKLLAKRAGTKHYYHLGFLWNYSRNPNHAGEVLCWFGLALVSLNVFVHHPVCKYNIWILIISQVGFIFTSIIMLFEATLASERKNNKRFGKESEYLCYKRQTSVLFPVPSALYNVLPLSIRKIFLFDLDLYNQGIKVNKT